MPPGLIRQPSRPLRDRLYRKHSQGKTQMPRKEKVRSFKHWKDNMGCFVRALILMVFIAVAIGLVLIAVAIYQYYAVAATLPSVDDLKTHASQFETTRILDRNGNLLYEIARPQCRQTDLYSARANISLRGGSHHRH